MPYTLGHVSRDLIVMQATSVTRATSRHEINHQESSQAPLQFLMRHKLVSHNYCKGKTELPVYRYSIPIKVNIGHSTCSVGMNLEAFHPHFIVVYCYRLIASVKVQCVLGLQEGRNLLPVNGYNGCMEMLKIFYLPAIDGVENPIMINDWEEKDGCDTIKYE